MCVPVRICVSVYARVCFRHPALAAASYGRVCPAQRLVRASQAKGRRHKPERTPISRRPPGPQYYFPQQAGRLRRDCGSTPLAHAPQGPQRKFGFRASPSPIPVRVATASKGGSPATQPSMGRLSPSIPLPGSQNFSSGEGSPMERDPVARGSPAGGGRKGALTSARLIAAVRGPTRVRACGGCQRGWGCPERGLRAMPSGRAVLRERGAESEPLSLPPVSAGGGLSRSSRSSPHATD